MDFSKLTNKEKKRLFEFIAHLAILAGREMSESGYANFNDVVLEFLNDVALIDEFISTASKVRSPIGFNCIGKC